MRRLRTETAIGGLDREWDAHVAGAPGGSHVQTSRWGLVKADVGWDVARVVVRDDDRIVGGCQLLVRRAGPVSLAYVPRGPLCPPGDAEVIDAILRGASAAVPGRRPAYLKIQPPAHRADLEEELGRRGFAASTLETAPGASVLVDLTAEPDEILRRMRSGVRANIRKATRRGVVVREGGSEDFGTFAELVGATSRRQGFEPYPLPYFERMWTEFRQDGDAVLLIAEHEGVAVSALLAVGYNDTVSFKMGGWRGDRSPIRPNELTHWTAMQWARERGYRYYDFEGFPDEVERAFVRGEHPPEAKTGVTWFKLGFGGELVIFPRAYDSSTARWLRPAVRAAAPRLHTVRGAALRLLGRSPTREPHPARGYAAPLRAAPGALRALLALARPPFVWARGSIVRLLERREGIDTAGEIDAASLDLPAHAAHYKPSGWTTLRRALPRHEVTSRDVFLDLGCGKGRVVCQAAVNYPFARVVGVDAAPELIAAARSNVERIAGRTGATEVSLGVADVRRYEIPDDVTFVYLYNPFRGPVFEAAVQALLRSQQRRPRPIRVIYATPWEEPMLLSAGFRVVRRLRGLRPSEEWSRSNATVVLERP